MTKAYKNTHTYFIQLFVFMMTSSVYNVNLPLSRSIVEPFLGLKPHPTKCQATYVWIDGTGEFMRSKTRTLSAVPSSIQFYPIWNYDGSSTNQASGNDSDVYLHPVADFPDPFFGGNNRLVICDTYNGSKQPTATNHRAECKALMDKCAAHKPWFGMEQEYLLLDGDRYPLGWPKGGYPAPKGPYYCGVGADKVFGREVVETHYRACLYANIDISGTNAEVTPGQWEFQVGPCEGIDMGDQLWMARYLLHRTAEQFGVIVSFDPKPTATAGDWNGAGCHTNFSTVEMREKNGIKYIKEAINKLSLKHKEHLAVYDPNNGSDNTKRLASMHEDEFTWGIADRYASVRIPRQVAEDGHGYLEDRRPSSNCDPYRVTAAVLSTILVE